MAFGGEGARRPRAHASGVLVAPAAQVHAVVARVTAGRLVVAVDESDVVDGEAVVAGEQTVGILFEAHIPAEQVVSSRLFVAPRLVQLFAEVDNGIAPRARIIGRRGRCAPRRSVAIDAVPRVVALHEELESAQLAARHVVEEGDVTLGVAERPRQRGTGQIGGLVEALGLGHERQDVAGVRAERVVGVRTGGPRGEPRGSDVRPVVVALLGRAPAARVVVLEVARAAVELVAAVPAVVLEVAHLRVVDAMRSHARHHVGRIELAQEARVAARYLLLVTGGELDVVDGEEVDERRLGHDLEAIAGVGVLAEPDLLEMPVGFVLADDGVDERAALVFAERAVGEVEFEPRVLVLDHLHPQVDETRVGRGLDHRTDEHRLVVELQLLVERVRDDEVTGGALVRVVDARSALGVGRATRPTHGPVAHVLVAAHGLLEVARAALGLVAAVLYRLLMTTNTSANIYGLLCVLVCVFNRFLGEQKCRLPDSPRGSRTPCSSAPRDRSSCT